MEAPVHDLLGASDTQFRNLIGKDGTHEKDLRLYASDAFLFRGGQYSNMPTVWLRNGKVRFGRLLLEDDSAATVCNVK